MCWCSTGTLIGLRRCRPRRLRPASALMDLKLSVSLLQTPSRMSRGPARTQTTRPAVRLDVANAIILYCRRLSAVRISTQTFYKTEWGAVVMSASWPPSSSVGSVPVTAKITELCVGKPECTLDGTQGNSASAHPLLAQQLSCTGIVGSILSSAEPWHCCCSPTWSCVL